MYVRYQVIGTNSVAVPTHFFKVIVAETADQKLDMEGYVMPNQVIDDSTPLAVFQVSGKLIITLGYCKTRSSTVLDTTRATFKMMRPTILLLNIIIFWDMTP
jgi:DNA/RNA endonuclease G (NUC1)